MSARATDDLSHYGSRRPILRLAATWLITALGLHLAALAIPGVTVDGAAATFGGAAVIGLLNALVWPVFIRFALPITVLTLGLAGLVLNGIFIWAAAELSERFTVSSPWSGIGAAAVMTALNTVLTSLLAIDDDDFYYRNVVKRQAKRRGVVSSDVPAVVFLEIDGLAREVLVRAIRDGNAPTMARWMRDGSHRLIGWETDWSSQTGASQTGILHGTNDDIPGFRWWDKERGVAVASSAPRDVMAIEERLSDGRGLLFADGASRANMYSGDAPHSLLTMSTVLRRDRPGKIGQDYFAYFANPYSLVRTLLLVFADVASELWDAAQQRRRDVRPRAPHRGIVYALVRAWTTVVQRELQVAAVIGDLYRGCPVVYTTFTGYDEVAHHSGIERAETLKILRNLDRQFARLEEAARSAPRPTRFVVLSDHGQSQGATFEQRFDTTLEEIVKQACATASVEVGAEADEGLMYIGASMTEISQGEGALAAGVRTATRRKQEVDGTVVLGPERAAETRLTAAADLPEVVVMASGCLGLIFFPREPGRVTLERLDELYPQLVPALRSHPGIGFLLVRSDRHGAVALGARGTAYLDEQRVEGEDPLASFGANAATHLKRTDGFPNCGDIMLNSPYWSELDEVAAFEGLVGSHGGLGGAQTQPFVLVPSDWTLPDEPVVGAGQLHTWLRRWLVETGHEAYRSDRAEKLDRVDAPVSSTHA